MSAYSITEPSVRQKRVAGSLVILYALITLLPLVWIVLTGFETPPDFISYPPKGIFSPSLEGYVNLFTTRARVTSKQLAELPPPANFAEQIMRDRGITFGAVRK